MRNMMSVAIVAAFLLPTLPVMADPPPWAPAHGRRAKDAEREDERDRDRYEHRDHDRDDRARFYYRDDHRHHERRLVRYDGQGADEFHRARVSFGLQYWL